MLGGVRKPQDAPQNLLHIHLAGLIGKGGQDIGKGAVPALFQCVDRDNVSDGAVGREQVPVFQFVDIGGANGDLLGGDAGLHQLVPQFFKGGALLLAPGLGLE